MQEEVRQPAETLRRLLDRSGFRAFYLAFREGNLRIQDWQVAVNTLDSDLQMLVRLFLLQQKMERDSAEKLLGQELLQWLTRHSVFQAEGTIVRSNQFFLVGARSLFFFAQVAEEPWAYYGEDSLALAVYQTPVPSGHTLDLCAGPGIQTMVSALHASMAVGVEINPATLAIASFNACLNGLQDRITFLEGDVEQPHKKLKPPFDKITFNPPLVPAPDELHYAFVGHGGPFGTRLTETIIKTYAPYLKPDGRMEFVGAGLANESEAEFVHRLGTLAAQQGMESRFHVLSRHAIEADAPLFNLYAAGIARQNKLQLDEAREQLISHFHQQGFKDFLLFFGSLKKVSHPKLPPQVVDLSFHYYGDWFV